MKTPSPITVDRPIDDSYIPECLTWYGAGVTLILLRYVTRIRTVGLSGFSGDDYLTFLYLLLYTACIIIVYVTYYTGATMNVIPDKIDLLTNEDIDIVRFGTQVEYASFFIYSGCIWTLKFCVLFFYDRHTLGVLRPKTIRFLYWFCALSYFLVCAVAVGSCWPISKNWQVQPLPGPECTFRAQNFWALVVLNVISDAALMSLPVPIIWNLRVPLGRKIGVGLLLSSAIFVIATAVVRAVLTMTGTPTVITINLWGFRELGIGLGAVIAPVLTPLFTSEFWKKGPYIRKDRRRMMQPSFYERRAGGFRDLNMELETLGEGPIVRCLDDADARVMPNKEVNSKTDMSSSTSDSIRESLEV